MSRSHYTSLGDGGATNGRSSSRSARPPSTDTAQVVLGLTTRLGELVKVNNRLDRALARLGTAADTSDFRDRLHDDQQEFSALIKDTMAALHAAKAQLDGRQFTRLSLQFDAAYKKYHRLQAQLDERQKQLLSHHIANDSSYGATAQHSQSQLGQTQTQTQVQAEEQEVVFTEWHHEEVVRRVEEIQQIEGEVAEVAELYKELHALVGQQQEAIDVVSEHVGETRHRVEEAQGQLEGAERHQKKARTKKCCVAVLVVACVATALLVLALLKG